MDLTDFFGLKCLRRLVRLTNCYPGIAKLAKEDLGSDRLDDGRKNELFSQRLRRI
jgi:hypothetical protein